MLQILTWQKYLPQDKYCVPNLFKMIKIEDVSGMQNKNCFQTAVFMFVKDYTVLQDE